MDHIPSKDNAARPGFDGNSRQLERIACFGEFFRTQRQHRHRCGSHDFVESFARIKSFDQIGAQFGNYAATNEYLVLQLFRLMIVPSGGIDFTNQWNAECTLLCDTIGKDFHILGIFRFIGILQAETADDQVSALGHRIRHGNHRDAVGVFVLPHGRIVGAPVQPNDAGRRAALRKDLPAMGGHPGRHQDGIRAGDLMDDRRQIDHSR